MDDADARRRTLPGRPTTRRAVVGASAWALPVVVVAGAAPAFASSTAPKDVDITVVPTSVGVDDVTYLLTLTNNTGSPIENVLFRWDFLNNPRQEVQPGSMITADFDAYDFAFDRLETNDDADASLPFRKVTALEPGSTSTTFNFKWLPATYRASVVVTVFLPTGTGGMAVTTYAPTGSVRGTGRAAAPYGVTFVLGADGRPVARR